MATEKLNEFSSFHHFNSLLTVATTAAAALAINKITALKTH
jgi:hypothetical protein